MAVKLIDSAGVETVADSLEAIEFDGNTGLSVADYALQCQANVDVTPLGDDVVLLDTDSAGTPPLGDNDYINELFFRDATETPITLPWHPRAGANLPALNLTTRAMEQARDVAVVYEPVVMHDAPLSGLNLSMTGDLITSGWVNLDIVCLIGRANVYEFGASWTTWKNTAAYYQGGIYRHGPTSYHARIYRKVLGSNYVLVTDTEAQATSPLQIAMTITGSNPVVINVYFDGVLKGTYSDSDATRINAGPYAGVAMVARVGTGVLGLSRFGVAVI